MLSISNTFDYKYYKHNLQSSNESHDETLKKTYVRTVFHIRCIRKLVRQYESDYASAKNPEHNKHPIKILSTLLSLKTSYPYSTNERFRTIGTFEIFLSGMNLHMQPKIGFSRETLRTQSTSVRPFARVTSSVISHVRFRVKQFITCLKIYYYLKNI